MRDQLETCGCVCGRAIYWDAAYGGYWAHLYPLEWGEKPHTPTPADLA